jgi:hypothetical protein
MAGEFHGGNGWLCVLAQCMSELMRRDGADWSSLVKMMRA